MAPQEQASLREPLAPIKDKIINFGRAEKHRKKRWLFKKYRKDLIRNYTSQGKSYLTLSLR